MIPLTTHGAVIWRGRKYPGCTPECASFRRRKGAGVCLADDDDHGTGTGYRPVGVRDNTCHVPDAREVAGTLFDKGSAR